jgi:hypothetical protein
MRHHLATAFQVGLLLSLALCGTCLARGSDLYDLSEPSLVISDGEAGAGYSYFAKINTELGQPAEYGYPTLGALPLVGPVPGVKPRRASLRPQVVVAKRISQFRREIAPKARRVSISSVSSSRKITARMPIIVGLFR